VIDRFFNRHNNSLIVDVMGISYHISIIHDLYRIDQYDPVLAWSIRTTQVLKTILENTRGLDHVILDGRGNARYSAKLCRFISDNLPCKTTILASVPPELELGINKGKYDTIVDYAGMVDWQNFYTELSSQNIDWTSIELDSIVLALANRPSNIRAEYIKYIISIAGDRCRTSFGSREESTIQNTIYYTELMHPLPFPMLIDGTVSKTPLEQHRPPGEKLFSNLVQVVLESFEFEENYVFLTEKTFKCFAWHQLPIFVSTPGHVQKVRELGFDVFDDIFDGHVYDNTKQEIHYKMKVLSCLRNFISKYPTVEDCKKLRIELWPRIVKNNEHLSTLVKNYKNQDILNR
jgi:hypothetical protein